MNSIQYFTSLLAVGISIACLAAWSMERWQVRSARQQFRVNKLKPAVSRSLIDVFRPLFAWYAPALRRFFKETQRQGLKTQLMQAGLEDYSPEEFWAFQLFSPCLFIAFAVLLIYELSFLDMHYSLPWWVLLGLIGWGVYFPILWRQSLLKKRQHEIMLALPAFVDKLTLAVEAGLDFMAAMTRMTQHMPASSLQIELQQTVSAIQLGHTRAQALRALGARIGLRDVTVFVATLVQADRLGTSIGQVLRAQADRLRRERFESAERKGAIAAQKLLFPLIFFIMPAVFIVVFGPLLVRLLTGGLEGLAL